MTEHWSTSLIFLRHNIDFKIYEKQKTFCSYIEFYAYKNENRIKNEEKKGFIREHAVSILHEAVWKNTDSGRAAVREVKGRESGGSARGTSWSVVDSSCSRT